jgi:sarcosine/dimethylglycine N-methyltransferase
MSDHAQAINQHYAPNDLSARILDSLRNAGKDPNALTRDDLNAFDEFHLGGIAETRHLAQLAGLHEGMEVLDVGSGLGGPARTLAAEFGCRVVGLDLTQEFCNAAEMLTARVGLANQVSFQCDSALAMPFPESTFDVVWTQFVGMNIPDKATLYDQFRKVLKNGGRLALHEVIAGSGEALHLPVFWSDDGALSFLRPAPEIRQLLSDRGFKEITWLNYSQETIDWMRKVSAPARQEGAPRPSFGVIVENAQQKSANVLQNLEEGRIVVMMAVLELAKP